MPDLSALLSPLKSIKTALAVFLFSAALLFAPFDDLGLKRPSFTTDYESYFVAVFFLSAAILAVELLSSLWRLAKRPYYMRKRRQWVERTFLSLNLEELCVLWAMTRSGTKTIKGSSSNYLLLSLRQKGCLNLMPGIQTFNQLHHAMPDDIFEIVSERGLARMPDDFTRSTGFEDRVHEILLEATDRWS